VYLLALNGVYVELSALVPDEQQILDASGNAFVVIDVSSALTQDSVQLLLKETGKDTDVYRSIKPLLLSPELTGDGAFCPGNGSGALPMEADFTNSDDICVLNSAIDDVLTTTFTNVGSGETVSDTAVVDPTSRVFDSTSLTPVEGAIVTFYVNGEVQTDPVSGEQLIFTTDELGRYTIPRLTPDANYSIDVTPPEGYTFPSTVAPAQFIDFTVASASYGIDGYAENGGMFAIAENVAPPIIDIPLDPENRNVLLQTEKTVDVSHVDVGDIASYSITVKNQSNGLLQDVSVIDYPAFGFKFIAGSATFDGKPIENPQHLVVPANAVTGETTEDDTTVNGLRFQVDEIDPNAQGVLRYSMRATAGAIDGNGINRANANAATVSGLLLSTPTSMAKVGISRSGVLSDQATLFGKVYVDSSCDNVQNNGEWPIGGVRLYLQDGTYVVSDEDGQFSLYGLNPGLHVLKLDTLTLPEGLALKPTDTRQAADPESRFVELSAGDFHRADFATFCPQEHAEKVFDELKARNQHMRNAWLLNDASRYDPDAKTPALDVRKRADTDGDLSQGLLGFRRTFDERNDNTTKENGVATNSKNTSDKKKPDPDEGTVLSAREITKPNNKAVDRSQIGEQIVNRRESAQLVTWYGVRLVPGLNQVEVRAKDAFGNDRVLAEGAFRRPSAGVRLRLRTKQDTLEADGGQSQLPIDVVITDAHNNPANGVYFVTLRSNGGAFVEEDLQAREPGMQIRVENGFGRVHLRSTELTGNVQIQASTGALSANLNVVQIAAARPLIGAGLIDIGGQWNKVNKGSDARASLSDEFETDARIAFFLKGKIRNDLHLTMSYDSEKNKEVDLLRDLNPNEHYATYGDSSSRGVEAQSRSKLYVKVEKDRNSVMWGDYLTDNQTVFEDVARVQRTMTGVNAVLEEGNTKLQIFAAEENSTRTTEEIPGNGTALLYQLARSPLVINSEVVERIVRDRNNPGLVLSTETLLRYSDYTLDYTTGLLRFSDVVPTVDSDLNPVFIRISYDLNSAAEKYLVTGFRFSHQYSQRFTAGISLTDDQNPLSGYTVGSVSAIAHLTPSTKLSGSFGLQSHRTKEAQGDAQRVQLEHAWKGRRDYRTSMTWIRASKHFENPSAGVSTGREEWRLDHRQPITNTLKGFAEATHSESLTDNSGNSTASLSFEKTFSNWSARFGAKHTRSFENSNQSLSFNTILLGAEKRFTVGSNRRGSIGFDFERDVQNAKRNRIGVTARLQVHQHVESYARFESERGLSFQSYGLTGQRNNQFTAGLESDILPSTKLYSEYRMRGNDGGDSIETASGIRGRFELEPGLTVSPAFEVIDVLHGEQAQDSIAVSLGLSDTRNPNRKFTSQAEIRQTDDSRYYGFRGAMAQRLNVDWTGLVREEFTRQTPDIGELTSRHRFTLGLARRPKRDNAHHTLFMANWKQDYGPQDGSDRTTYMLSTHQNRRISPNAVLSGRFGTRWTKSEFSTGALRSQVTLTDLRATFDLNRRWELDLRGGWLGTGGPGDGRYSAGLGLSWIAERNLRLGVRYNVIGFREDDLDEQNFNQQGVRIGLQLKFDEDWFTWLE